MTETDVRIYESAVSVTNLYIDRSRCTMKLWRANLILIILIFFGAAIISRLIYIQILNHDYWKALAQGQQKYFSQIKGQRGEIFLQIRGGGPIPLAINQNGKLVYVSPREIEKKAETAKALSQILNLDENLILEKLKKDTLYELIKSKLAEEEIENLKNFNLTGIYLAQEVFRRYPQENLAAPVVGFLGGEEIGQYGLEEYYDGILGGEDGFIEGERGSGGFLISSVGREGIKGADLFLTLDYNIQYLAERLLKEAEENELKIEGGQIIVMEPHSGRIIALVNFPGFNPNQYSQITDFGLFQNGAIQKIFEPGSVFKPMTMAAALNEQVITPQTTYIDEGRVQIGGYTIYNYDGRVWGEKTMTEVLEKSINSGAVFAEKKLGHELFLDYLRRFGFFEKTEIDLIGEIFSQNKEFQKGYEINFATASFGQGIEITSIQLARAFSAIANGGKLVQPYLVEKISEGDRIVETQPEILRDSIVSPKTISQLTAMLVSVVENGFAKRAKIPGYYIAGKTGTAQIPWSALGISKSGYSEKTIQSFVGFAPAFNPQFLILVKLDNPQTKTAEYSAVPIFHELAKYIIDYWQIPPDYE